VKNYLKENSLRNFPSPHESNHQDKPITDNRMTHLLVNFKFRFDFSNNLSKSVAGALHKVEMDKKDETLLSSHSPARGFAVWNVYFSVITVTLLHFKQKGEFTHPIKQVAIKNYSEELTVYKETIVAYLR
jgi:hypothetical protein